MRVGVTLRDALNVQEAGDCRAILPKNVVQGGVVGAPLVGKSDFRSDQFLAKGDVLVTNRGQIKALVFCGGGGAVACGSLFVVRVKSRWMLPEFLAAIINFGIIQREYARYQETTTVSAITRSQFLDIELPVVSLEKQKKVLKMLEVHNREIGLIARISELKNDIVKAIIKGELDG